MTLDLRQRKAKFAFEGFSRKTFVTFPLSACEQAKKLSPTQEARARNPPLAVHFLRSSSLSSNSTFEQAHDHPFTPTVKMMALRSALRAGARVATRGYATEAAAATNTLRLTLTSPGGVSAVDVVVVAAVVEDVEW